MTTQWSLPECISPSLWVATFSYKYQRGGRGTLVCSRTPSQSGHTLPKPPEEARHIWAKILVAKRDHKTWNTTEHLFTHFTLFTPFV